jgi:ABC transport system ATP-binding/permease protein
VLLGDIEPDSGKRVIGKMTKVAYYDQNRAQLDPEQTVYDAAAQGEDWVELGESKISIRDYLDDLLFPVPMQRMKVKALSGGERNRLLLARLFLEGANVLVLDEPTNDLDIVTLNVLERLLLAFGGSVMLVTHDRYFLDKVATAILALEGDGKAIRYPGNFEMYRKLKGKGEAAIRAAGGSQQLAQRLISPPESGAAKKGGQKMGYMELRELEGMERAIETAERKKADLEAAMANPKTQTDSRKLQELSAQLNSATFDVEKLYKRWAELEEKKKEMEK